MTMIPFRGSSWSVWSEINLEGTPPFVDLFSSLTRVKATPTIPIGVKYRLGPISRHIVLYGILSHDYSMMHQGRGCACIRTDTNGGFLYTCLLGCDCHFSQTIKSSNLGWTYIFLWYLLWLLIYWFKAFLMACRFWF